MDRVVVFIDGSNFYHGLKEHTGKTNIDFERFAELLCAGRPLVRTYYYNSPVNREDGEDRYRNQQKFLERIKQVPYLHVKLGRLQRRAGGVIEKGVDIKIAIDMLKYAHTGLYDVAILVSGDGDFAYAVNAVKDAGKHVEVAYFKDAKLYYLKEAADKFMPLDTDVLKDCYAT